MMGGLLPLPGSAPRAPSRPLFVVAAIVVPLALMVLALRLSGQVHESAVLRTLVRDSYEERINAAELAASYAQAEAAMRGYVITGNPAFVDVYETARTTLARKVAATAGFEADVGGKTRRAAALQLLVDRRMEQIDRVVEIRKRDGGDAAASAIANNQDALPADATLAAASSVNGAEASAITARIIVLRDRYMMFQHMVWALCGLFGAMLLGALWLTWCAFERRFVLERNAHDMSTRLLAMFAGITDAAFVLDEQGHIEAANAAAKRLVGYCTADLIGRDIVTLFDLEDHRDFMTRIGLIDGKLTRPYWLDRTIRHSDGSGVPVDIALGLLDLPDGLRVIMTMRDIAERKSIERLKDEFLATISHELRTPLTSVIGALGLLRSGSAGAMPDAADRLVEIAENNSRRLIRLVNDLLDIEKIGSGQMRFERVAIDLVHVAETAVDGALGMARERGIAIEIGAEDRPLTVQGDRERLLQVLANLLSNALRFTPDNGTVRVALEQRNGEAIVMVDDEGPGIPAEFNGRIFERFAQASTSHEGGSGLGLAISREIVGAHDGRIWFGRSPQGGARFAFALALSRTERLRGSRSCILLAEGDPEEAQRLQAMLEAENCAVECVDSDRAALSAAISGRYEALVIDIELPAMGGLETVRALRRRAETRALPVILLSAHGVADAAGAGPALEPVEWIDKPVDQGRLIAAVRRAITDSVSSRPTLLHIDDDVDMLEVAAVILAEHGRVVHATSLASARAMLCLQRPDIVILDLGLPDGSGCELLEELRHLDGTAIPTIIYTATDVPPEFERQVDAVLVKSRRSLDSLGLTIKHVLTRYPNGTAISA